MYKRHTGQLSMFDDPQFFGSLPLDPNNEWVKFSKLIPWHEFDLKYRENFKSKKGQPACRSRMALGSLLIKPAYKGMSDEDDNEGTLILDATCIPQGIRFPTDTSLLNEARVKTEVIIDVLHENGMTEGVKPRTYRKQAKNQYNGFSKSRKKTAKMIRTTIIFRTRENLRYCKERGIHMNGPKFGKPYSDPKEQKLQKKLEWPESGERGEIERSFGVGKNRYTLDRIVTKLKETSEVSIHAAVLYMNLRKKPRLLFALFIRRLLKSYESLPENRCYAIA